MKVTVFRNHFHAGIFFPAGSEVDLPDDAAQYLIDIEQARRAGILQVTQQFRAIMERPLETPPDDR